jgi:hypothetical protein
MSFGMGGDGCHLFGGKQVLETNEVCIDLNKCHSGGNDKAIF